MSRWIVLPYDDSPVARAAVRRAAGLGRDAGGGARLMLAVAGVDPAAVPAAIEQARAVCDPDATLDAQLLAAGEPGAALARLAESLPDAIVAAPIGARGDSAWYAAAVRGALREHSRPRLAFYVDPGEVARMAGEYSARPGIGAPLRATLHECLRPLRRRPACLRDASG